ncbi:MAG: hypothetical protein ACJA01_004480, partial [Saprospiraceae bacterium]
NLCKGKYGQVLFMFKILLLLIPLRFVKRNALLGNSHYIPNSLHHRKGGIPIHMIRYNSKL